MMAHTDTDDAPWHVVPSDSKRQARLNCIHHLLSVIDYERLTVPDVELPPKQDDLDYKRPPLDTDRIVPQTY